METVETFPALFAGYSVIWLLVVVYIYCIGKKVKALWAQQESNPQKKPVEK